MLAPQKTTASESWIRTRRNLLQMCPILAGAALSGCKGQTLRHERVKQDRPNCFLKGTSILTPGGERKIEKLQIGDPICTLEGESKEIRWIGRRKYNRHANEQWAENIKPVRICRGALQTDAPHSDLFVSQSHLLYLDGLLIRAADIINGGSITLDDCTTSTELEYLHILVDRHDIAFADGIPSETLLPDPHILKLFDNSVDAATNIPSNEPAQPRAPVYADFGRLAMLRSHMRSALSPIIDRRTTFDRLRDRLLIRDTGLPITHSGS
jgi:hypothetical protein